MSRAFNQLLSSQQGSNIDFQRELFCAQPQRFRRHVRAHVAAMAPHGFTATAVGVLTARDARLLLRDPDWLSVQFEMLRAFFVPYGDAPATVARMTKGLQASLPAVVPDANQPQIKSSGPRHHADLSCVHRAMLAGPTDVLLWTREGLKQHMRTLGGGGPVRQRRRGAARVHVAAEAAGEPQVALVRRAQGGGAGGGRQLGRRARSMLLTCSLQAACPCLLLWKRLRCALVLPSACVTRFVKFGSALVPPTPAFCARTQWVPDVRPDSRSTRPLCAFCSKGFSMLHCFDSRLRESMVAKYGASGVEGAKPSFKDHTATAEGQAELRAFVQRVDARVQQDWNKLASAPDRRCAGASCISVSVMPVVTSSTCIFHSHRKHGWCPTWSRG